MVALSLISPPQGNLPHPFLLKEAELKAGNPLAPYVEALRFEKAYDAAPALRSDYWQARGTFAAYLGDPAEADRDWSVTLADLPGDKVMKTNPLEGYRPEDAVATIARMAKGRRWVMVGEEHLKPQTRTILPALLRALYKQGFRTLTAETFRTGEPLARTQATGTVTYDTGGYTADPVFASGVREAVRLGYQLVAYEAEEQPTAGDFAARANFREALQARNLKERIFDKDPKAKVLVWAGRGHVAEEPLDIDGTSKLEPMAYAFRKLTGEDPLSVYAAMFAEQSERRYERPEYRWVTDRGLVRRPTAFIRSSGEMYGKPFDLQVFWPRTNWVRGRPDWLMREMGRWPRLIPSGLVKEQGLQLAQAFYEGEEPTAVPVDQVLIRPGEPLPTLMLPPKGRFWVRVLDAEGRENGRAAKAP